MADMVEPERVTVKVNDREIEVQSGLNILQALGAEGIAIPSLCNDVRLKRANGSCGMCVVEVGSEHVRDVKACLTPITPGMEIKTHTDRLEAYRKVRLEQLLCDHNADCVAPCVQTCPANIDIQTYLQLVADGNFEAAIRVIKDRNPFPSACGRVCPHPCEDACRRNLADEPVAINAVKRFAADWDMARKKQWRPRVAPHSGKRIAVIGAGPSGLAAANYLAIAGHGVTVFENQPEPGGMMRYGIPEYRLPKATLDKEIDLIESLGVNIVCNKALGTHLMLEDLKRDFDAVYLAIGSWRATPLGIDGEHVEGVELGINYLRHVTKGNDAPIGDNVIVIGGGNTAIDCARAALRRGAKNVKLVYRRTQDEMPAQAIEVHEALREGVEMVFLAAPQKITVDGSGMKALHCMRMELGEPDRSGRRRPVPVEGSNFVIEAHTIIGAIGQNTDTGFLYNDLPVRLNKWGNIDVDGFSMQTSEAKIFSGGDCVTGPATVIAAIAAGRRAADAIGEFLTPATSSPATRTTRAAGGPSRTCRKRSSRTSPTSPAPSWPSWESKTVSAASPKSSSDSPRPRPVPRRAVASRAVAPRRAPARSARRPPLTRCTSSPRCTCDRVRRSCATTSSSFATRTSASLAVCASPLAPRSWALACSRSSSVRDRCGSARPRASRST